jgi:hypothetical protein
MGTCQYPNTPPGDRSYLRSLALRTMRVGTALAVADLAGGVRCADGLRHATVRPLRLPETNSPMPTVDAQGPELRPGHGEMIL